MSGNRTGLIAVIVAAAGGLLAFVVMIAVIALITSTIAAPFLKIVQIGHWFSHLFGGGGADARQELIKYANQIDSGNGKSIHDDLLENLDCTALPPKEKDNYCIQPVLSEDQSPIPPDKLWLVPVWQAAAARYKIPWELLAAVNAARSNFGAVNCDLRYSAANVGNGIGFYRTPRVGWLQFGDDGKLTGHATTTDLAGGCHKSDQPVDLAKDGSSSPFDAVDASWAMAAQLATHGAAKKTEWNYNGDSTKILGVPRFNEPYNPYVSADTALYSGSVGATPDSVTLLGDIPRNYLILFVSSGKKFDFPWDILAGIAKTETDDGRSRLDGVQSGWNSYVSGGVTQHCCSGPMQFNLKDTWHDPSPFGERVWEQPKAAMGLAADYNKDGKISVWDPRDAVPAAAKKLSDAQKAHGLHSAILSYNNAEWYVQKVLALAAGYKKAAAAHPDVLNKLLLDNQTGATGSGQDHSGDPTGNPKKGCTGPLPDDAISAAVGWTGEKPGGSACYIDTVHDWYQAIISNPPNQVTANRLAMAITIAKQELAKGITEIPFGCNRGPDIDGYLGSVGIDPTKPAVNNCFLDEPKNKLFNIPVIKNREWCAAFLSWVLQKAGVQPVTLPTVNGGKGSASVQDYVNFATDKGILRQPGKFTPSPGDLVVFGGAGHIGLVVSRSGGTSFDTIEGNSGGTVAQRTYLTTSHEEADYNISAFIDLTSLYGDTEVGSGQIGAAGLPIARGALGGLITSGVKALENYAQSKGCQITSETGGKHAEGSYHYRGEAIDLDYHGACVAVWQQLYTHSPMFVELFGPTAMPSGGLYHYGEPFSDFSLQAEHQNHIHVAYTGSPEALQAAGFGG
jgi:hypothetical protein